ncbi:hypothetical protein [Jeotgalibacillus sp. JSM ZJ347]|uniref:hypothetical protein n=1 Tax=Jeotgalibacillus sp. JSM ZJ347 TaxID=3342117 RepID=UPI0035A8B609
MSLNAILFAFVAGILTFILINSVEPVNPILITNILLGLIAGLLIDKRKTS